MNTNQPSSHADNITMSGGGLYSLATKGAKDVIDHATPLVVDTVKSMNLNNDLGSFRMVDMGCADGGTSLQMVESVLKHVNSVAPEASLNVVYSDQPRNDFNALVQILHGLTDFDSYLQRFTNLYTTFSGSSFYLQALENGSLDLGFSATAMHWLSKKPCDISNHVHMVGAEGEELKQFADQAATDWQTILTHRARELRSGGRLVLVNFCKDPQGQYLGNTGGINMFDNFNQNWIQFLDQGRITEQEYKKMTLPQYYNTVEEFKAPLESADSKCYQLGLRLENIETKVVPCPFSEAFKDHGDVEEFADGLIPTSRTWNESIFFGGLDQTRPLAERQSIIEDYYGTYRHQVLKNPEGHGMDYVHAYMTVRKE